MGFSGGGIARGMPTYFQALLQQQKISNQLFALCLTEHENGGVLVFGEVDETFHTGSMIWLYMSVSSQGSQSQYF